MFIDGFEKVAARINPKSFAYQAERAMNWPVGLLKSRGQRIRGKIRQFHENAVAGGKAGRTPTRHGPGGEIRKNPGGSLSEKRVQKQTQGLNLSEEEKTKLHSSVELKTQKDLAERKAKLDEHRAKVKRGPSFAMRHPFITTGGTLLAAKHLLGDKKDQDGAYGAQDMNPVG